MSDQFEGVYILKGVFQPEELQFARDDQSLLAVGRKDLMKEDAYVALYQKPRIQNAIKAILNKSEDQYHMTTLSSNTLFQDIDTRNWHVDYPYDSMARRAKDINTLQFPKEILGVQVNIPLDTFTEENGCTMFVPNSHKARGYPTDTILRRGYFYDAIDLERMYPAKKKFLPCELGDVILYPSYVWHSAGLNKTETPRRAVLANFSPLNVPKKGDL